MKEKQNGAEEIFKGIPTRNFLSQMKDINAQISGAQQTTNMINTKKTTANNFIDKPLKPEDQRVNLKNC